MTPPEQEKSWEEELKPYHLPIRALMSEEFALRLKAFIARQIAEAERRTEEKDRQRTGDAVLRYMNNYGLTGGELNDILNIIYSLNAKIVRPDGMTFEDYLRAEMDEGKIDFAIRAERHAQGRFDTRLKFYIHAQGKNGDTKDYEVTGNSLTPLFQTPNDRTE